MGAKVMKKDKNAISSALFGVAGIQAVVGLLGWSVHGPNFTPVDWVITFSFAIFAALAIVAGKARVPAAVIAVALYSAFLGLQASISFELLTAGLIFKLPIVLLLLIALVFAFKTDKTAAHNAGRGTDTSKQD